MKKIVAILFSFLYCAANTGFASTITFDDLDATSGDVSLDALSPYQDFTWANFSAYTETPGFAGFNNGIVSGTNAAYSGGEFFSADVSPVIGKITSANLFDLQSLYLGSGYYDNLLVTVEGRREGALVSSSTFKVGTSGSVFGELNFLGIDEIDLFASVAADTQDNFGCGSFNCTMFTIDDINVSASNAPPASVLEPSSLSLLGAAGLAMATFRFRSNKRDNGSGKKLLA